MTARVVVGIGLSSSASAQEVRDLVTAALRAGDLGLGDVGSVATRHRLAGDARLRLGPPVVGVDDAVLERASAPPARDVGIRARVAETAARVVAGAGATVGPVWRSAHATVAVARIPAEPRP